MKKEILNSISNTSADHEFYTPYPEGYVKGKTKYIVVFGTVISGLGKGIFSSGLGLLLQHKGLSVSPIKFDGYLNQDAGTLNPYRHGEVFVLDDGTECDMDLGTYERFLRKNLTKDNYLTGGKAFNIILEKERKGRYLGRDVQFIPHVTGEIKLFLRTLALKTNPDVITVEVGGTVGDIENMYFIEAMRQLMYEEGKENVLFVALTYILEPAFLGEQKSKAAQLGIRSLLSLGIQPDIIACRAQNRVTEKVREKISVYSNVPVKQVVSLHDVDSIYLVPGLLQDEQIDEAVIERLSLKTRKNQKSIKEWEQFVENILYGDKQVTIGITGKYTSLRDSYASILKALEHAGASLKCKVNVRWIETTDFESGKKIPKQLLKGVEGIIVPGGFGKRGTLGKIKCIQYARENNIPFLGICYGMQLAVIEYARNVCGINDANSIEIEPDTSEPVISVLPEQKKIEGLGGTMRLGGRDIEVKENTLAHKLYKKSKIRERFRHRYEVDPKYIEVLEKKGLVFSGKAPNVPIMQILEIPKHPYFIASQYHPEFTSRPTKPNPLFFGLVKAANKKV